MLYYLQVNYRLLKKCVFTVAILSLFHLLRVIVISCANFQGLRVEKTCSTMYREKVEPPRVKSRHSGEK